MNDAFGLIQKYTGISRLSKSEVVTPQWVASDMVDLLPADVFSPESKFLDPAVKSGRFLVELYNRLMASDAMKQAFQNEQARHEHILHNQLYGIAMSETAAIIARKQLYDNFTIAGNIIYTDGKFTRELVQGAFSNMKFDVVIGNPPYNNDMYLDFVIIGHAVARKYTVMITPAKWQAKADDNNEKFRKAIVPYMSKVVYYPDCSDVFNIGEVPGISYFILGNEQTSETKIINICKLQPKYNDEAIRSLRSRETLFNKGNILNEKLRNCIKFDLRKTPKGKRYQVWTNNKVAIGGGKSQGTLIYSNEGALQCLQISRLVDSSNALDVASIIADSQQTFSSDSKEECESFISWIYTKFVRYLLSINLCGLTGIANSSNDWWRFVPAPKAFDHIFTDDELYKTYGLTPEEIKIIESVIKERKL